MLEVVCVILEKDGKIFIAERGEGIAEHIWEFPGGKVEDGETQIAACIREIKEELDVDIEVGSFICDVIDDTFDIPVHVFAYKGCIINGEITLHVHHQYRFVTIEEAFHYEFQKADIKILKTLQAL